MRTQAERFLRNEFLTMSILGALGRSRTYAVSASPEEKNRFRIALREKLDCISRWYESAVTEEAHLSNIIDLSVELSSRFSRCLRNNRFRIGIAQKALNLYLKYLWCADLIAMPPHCPFDSIVIDHITECRELNWTSIDSIEDYNSLVLAARKVAGNRSLAEWECSIWLEGIQSERKSKDTDKSEAQAACEMTVSKSFLSSLAEGGEILITGTVISQGIYKTDCKDICEIYIDKNNSDALPHQYRQKMPISLLIGDITYEAGVHETKNGVVWISSVLHKKNKRREKSKLVNVLERVGLKKGDRIKIRRNVDSTYSLKP